ncbi:hypothetical protein ADIS_2869 [Lunatimonas lonarensis]|uniref:Uncharacterized protein n=1 Tax=Lunatimonas lonarensis TaxID=1232681 RepID=R7ZQX9_9BACT|nr:hypothetical protein ADIS_2869 [Lunatimonas lonarensis]
MRWFLTVTQAGNLGRGIVFRFGGRSYSGFWHGFYTSS